MRPDPFDAMEKEVREDLKHAEREAAEGVEAVVGATADAIEAGAKKTVDLTKKGIDTGVEHVTAFGRMVLRAWKFFEKISNPPWTWQKALAWAVIFLAVAVVTVLAYQVHYGILTLPMVEQVGREFVDGMAGLGAPGFFAFTIMATLFFMVIPTEPFFFIMLTGGTAPVAVIAAAALGSTIGSCINYWFGNRLRVSAGKKKPGEERKLGKWGKRAHSKSGTFLLLGAASLPLPELIALAYGVADYPFKKFVTVTLVGRFIKWSWIAAAFLAFHFSM